MREQQAEQGSQHPRERRVEDEARLARVEGRAEGPVRVQVDLAELARGFHPTDHVKVEVVAAGAAVDSERMHGKERRQRDEEEVGKPRPQNRDLGHPVLRRPDHRGVRVRVCVVAAWVAAGLKGIG